jgi:DNA-binding IclR family transcriptional regulator
LLERDRDNGHASAVEEFEQGLTELALPLRDRSGRVIAALSVVTRQVPQHVHERMVAELTNASLRLQELTAGD